MERGFRSPPWLMLATTLLAFAPAIVPTLAAQTADSRTESQNATDNSAAVETAQQAIDQGLLLEGKSEWADALSLYQKAIKVWPKNRQLLQRRSISRIHYDLHRRYSNNSFCTSLKTISPTEALNIYSEVLLKVQSYYVDQPNWSQLASFGLLSLEVAGRSPEFRQTNVPNISEQELVTAIDQIKRSLTSRTIKSRHDAFVIASSFASQLQKLVGLPEQSTIYEFTNGAIAALDPYSSFMSGSQYGEAMSQIEGNFVGLGVELRTHDDHLEIVSVIPGGPAHVGNVAPADRIIAVDGKQVESVGSERAADMLRGVDGSYVAITVERKGMKTQSVRLKRRRVEIPSVEDVRIVDRKTGVGYIRLTNFQKTTIRDFDAAMWKLHRDGMKSLIVDVRGNPGGLLSASVDVANRFVPRGVIVSTRGRNPIEDYTHRAQSANTWQIPLVVMIDENSASASEIFAAAIRDHRRGTIVGQQSFGKGSVQGIFPLNVAGGGVRLTTARFYSPRGLAISEVGVKPDVDVQYTAFASTSANSDTNSKRAEDAALRVGIQVASRAAMPPRHNSVDHQSIAGR